MSSMALLLVLAAAASCEKSSSTSVATAPAITACPQGAILDGSAPPKGLRQRCQKSVSERHGASREWYEDGTERTYTEWWEGRKHGRFILRYKTGKVRSEGAHVHGEPAGDWKYYAEDGTVQQQQTFPTAPPPAEWLAQAIAGQPPPPREDKPAAADGQPAAPADGVPPAADFERER
jgi:hypothetical protein